MKPKEALIKDGFPGVKMGKGRLPAGAKERLEELVKEGWNIDGYSVSSTASPETGEKKVTKVATSTEKVVMELRYKYADENAFEAVTKSGKVYGMREACDNCKYSLVGCFCWEPKIFNELVTVRSVKGYTPDKGPFRYHGNPW